MELAQTFEALQVRPLAPSLGAEITNVDLSKGLDERTFDAIYQALLRYQVLLFGPVELPPGRQVEFARPSAKCRST
jgi:taurine dioxygenase